MPELIREWIQDPTVQKALIAFLIVAIGFTVVKYSQRLLGKTIDDADTRYRLRKLVAFLGVILVASLVGIVFVDELGGVTVALGVAGAGIAFALQEVIASMAGWVALALGNFYHTGDRVKLGEIVGDVIDISFLRTTIMETGSWVDGDLYNGRIVRVANSFVFKSPVFNYSGEFPFLWDEIRVPIAHGSSIPNAQKIMEDALEATVGDYANRAEETWKKLVRKFLIEDAKVQPMVTMGFDENHVLFTLRYVVDYKMRRGTKDEISKIVLSAIDSDRTVSIATATLAVSMEGDSNS